MATNDGRISWAIWDPITDRSRLSNAPVRMTVHMAVTDADDIYGPGKGPGGTYAHAYNPASGRLRQHQDANRRAYADLEGNGSTFAVEHEGRPGDVLTAAQIDTDARLFAWLVLNHGVPNRIANYKDTRGLAWHRLGCSGNYGAFNSGDPTTWSAAQTGQRWSTSYGKTCPTDAWIRQIPLIYQRAQDYINRGNTTEGDDTLTDAQVKTITDSIAALARQMTAQTSQIPSRVWAAEIGRDESRRAMSQAIGQTEAKVDVILETLAQVPGVDVDALARKISERLALSVEVVTRDAD